MIRLIAGLLATGALVAAAGPASAQAPADVQFMRDMIAHHSQAIEMAAMVPVRTRDAQLRTLAERIDLSQRDEIQRMRTWLSARGDSSTTMNHRHMTDAGMIMPGFLTAAQLDSLRQSRGRVFQRRFLQYMIRHHEGALTMVAHLLDTPGGIRDPMLFQLANSIDADQRAEISRMRAILSTLAPREK